MRILIKPIITEKATLASERYNRYTFLVNTNANKIEIKKAVEAAYGVTVDKVRTLNYGPERKMRYTKTGIQKGKTNATKKAVVQVADGNAIDFYNNLLRAPKLFKLNNCYIQNYSIFSNVNLN